MYNVAMEKKKPKRIYLIAEAESEQQRDDFAAEARRQHMTPSQLLRALVRRELAKRPGKKETR